MECRAAESCWLRISKASPSAGGSVTLLWAYADDRTNDLQPRDPEPLRFADVSEEYHGVAFLLAKFLNEAGDPLFDEVISEVHDESRISEEIGGREHCMGKPEGGFLVDIGNVYAPGGAIANRLTNLLLGIADDNTDFLHTGVFQGFDAIEEYGLVGHRHQLLGACVGYGAETRSRTA